MSRITLNPCSAAARFCWADRMTRGVKTNDDLIDYFHALADRLHNVRVCCGDWERVCGPTPTIHTGVTGVFLDPPYSSEAGRDMGCYAIDDGQVAHRIRRWCLDQGDDPRLRIALCGYAGEGHEVLESAGWDCFAWKAPGGYARLGKNNDNQNRYRERVWFSPHCLQRDQLGLPFEHEKLNPPGIRA